MNTFTRALSIRDRVLDLINNRILIADLKGSTEANDSIVQINCKGFGRVRKFERHSLHFNSLNTGFDPRGGFLPSIGRQSKYCTQVFQLAGCSWQCWYCYVDANLLSGSKERAGFFSADELVSMYLQEENPPDIIDLSGGQPDLVPEWTLWMMEAIQKRGLINKVYLRSETNLSNEYLWLYLSSDQIKAMAEFPGHIIIGCFKGFDEESFSFNTGDEASGFEAQFRIADQLIADGFDVFFYVTLTCRSEDDIKNRIRAFMDKLQSIRQRLPLRVAPLIIKRFSATKVSNVELLEKTNRLQFVAYKAWDNELVSRFGHESSRIPYRSVKLLE